MKSLFRRGIAATLALALLFAGGAGAEEVQLDDKLANLELAPGKSLADGVVLMTHGTLAHGRMEIMAALQKLLKEQGVSSLAITLTLGQEERRGMYDCAVPHTHRHRDAMAEIGAWLAWLKGQGAQNVVLLGHSRGGNQTAWFAAEYSDPAVKSVVLIAPMTFDPRRSANSYEKRYGKPLQPILERAQALVAEGKGDTLLEHTDFIYCPDASVTAAAFADYYTPDAKLHTPNLLTEIPVPLLVVAGSDDQTVKGLIEAVEPLVDGERRRLLVIDGADHFFRDLYADEVVEGVVEFLGR